MGEVFKEKLTLLTRLFHYKDEKRGFGKDIENLKVQWLETITAELARFELSLPELGAYRSGAKQGLHTEHLGFILAELQYMQRSYPNMNW